MQKTPSVGCLVMAAGNARRFGDNKLAALVEGKTLIERALDAVPKELFTRVVVVTQYTEVESLAVERGLTVLWNKHPDWGISHTIRLGTTELQKDCGAICYMVSDQPLLKRESIAGAVDLYRRHPNCIVGLSHGGKRGNPCIFPREFFPELLELREDHGGNTVIRRHEDRLLLYEVGKQELTDVDTREALTDLVASQSAGKAKEV